MSNKSDVIVFICSRDNDKLIFHSFIHSQFKPYLYEMFQYASNYKAEKSDKE